MTTLFDDTDLFSSGDLRIQQFDLPDAELTLWEYFIQRAEADDCYHGLLAETPGSRKK